MLEGQRYLVQQLRKYDHIASVRSLDSPVYRYHRYAAVLVVFVNNDLSPSSQVCNT